VYISSYAQISKPLSCCISEDGTLNFASFDLFPNRSSSTLNPKSVPLYLLSCWWNLGNFGALVFKLWIFVHNCYNSLSSCMYAHFESNIWLYFVHMTTPVCPVWEKNFFYSVMAIGWSLDLRVKLQVSSSPVSRLSSLTCIPSKPLEFIHVGAPSCSWIDTLVMITSIFQSWAYSSWSCSQHFEKNVTCWVCICIARAFGNNLGWTNVHMNGRLNTHTLSLFLMFGDVVVQ
jgi:hypothetical protein